MSPRLIMLVAVAASLSVAVVGQDLKRCSTTGNYTSDGRALLRHRRHPRLDIRLGLGVRQRDGRGQDERDEVAAAERSRGEGRRRRCPEASERGREVHGRARRGAGAVRVRAVHQGLGGERVHQVPRARSHLVVRAQGFEQEPGGLREGEQLLREVPVERSDPSPSTARRYIRFTT